MSAEVIPLWGGRYEHRIRIPGPGENTFATEIIILPVVRIERAPAPRKRPTPRKRKTP